MITLTAPDDLCAGTTAYPIVSGCENNSRVEWQVITKPVGSQVIFSDINSENSGIDFTEDGTYIIRLCCFFDEGEITAQPQTGNAIDCPISVIAGQTGEIVVYGCGDATLDWTATGAATGISGANVASSGVATGTVTTGTTPGTGTVTVVCTIVDIDNNETTETLVCDFEVLPEDSLLTCVTSPPIEMDFITCGQSCSCAEATFVVDCQEVTCQRGRIGLVFKDCPECEESPECDPIEFLRLEAGSSSAAACSDLDECDCGECSICCDTHRPTFFYNNICHCPGWTLEAPAVEGSSIYNACSCAVGQQWCFIESATIVASGPPAYIDSVILWGHNLTSATVTTSPPEIYEFGPTNVELYGDDSCLEAVSKPVTIKLSSNKVDPEDPDPRENITDFTVTITGQPGQLICIDQIFIGERFKLPDDELPDGFVNPHNGTDYELITKESSCGPLSRALKHVPVPFEFELECMTDQWVCEEWRSFIRYAQRHGFYFQWSQDRKPEDLFYGWITNAIPGSEYTFAGEQTVGFSAEGYITQPQVKVVAP